MSEVVLLAPGIAEFDVESCNYLTTRETASQILIHFEMSFDMKNRPLMFADSKYISIHTKTLKAEGLVSFREHAHHRPTPPRFRT